MSERTHYSCEEFADSAAELALGTLGGEERARSLVHVDTCPSCRAMLQDLSLTSDSLLQLAPAAEPPVGFESRLFARVKDTAGPRRRWWKPALAFAAAASLAVAIGFSAGRVTARKSTSAQRAVAPVTVAHLVIGSNSRGEVVVSGGNPAWLFMTVRDVGPVTTVACQVTLTNGRTMRVGSFEVSSGYGGWAVPLSVPASQLRSAQVLGPDGATLATAQFST